MNNKNFEKVLISQRSENGNHNFGDIQESVDQIIEISHRRLS
jgi:hypothetical protein